MKMMELDPIERVLEKPVTRMTASELVTYIRQYHAAFDYDMPVRVHHRQVMQRFMDTNEHAGRIVQFAMLRLGGRREDGSPITPSSFSTKMQWWIDKVYYEMQVAERRDREVREQSGEVEGGWTSGDDFLDMFGGK